LDQVTGQFRALLTPRHSSLPDILRIAAHQRRRRVSAHKAQVTSQSVATSMIVSHHRRNLPCWARAQQDRLRRAMGWNAPPAQAVPRTRPGASLSLFMPVPGPFSQRICICRSAEGRARAPVQLCSANRGLGRRLPSGT
jgi:hypothetical protein